jgi:PHD/YefM family antitoxin component YafN of YafNO toxin-antitoxin module
VVKLNPLPLLERGDQSITTTHLAKNYAYHMARFASGEQDRLVVMKAGRPLAVCLSIQEFEKIQNELAKHRDSAEKN